MMVVVAVVEVRPWVAAGVAAEATAEATAGGVAARGTTARVHDLRLPGASPRKYECVC